MLEVPGVTARPGESIATKGLRVLRPPLDYPDGSLFDLRKSAQTLGVRGVSRQHYTPD